MTQAAHPLRGRGARVALSRKMACMALLLAESLLSRVPLLLIVMGVSLDDSLWLVLERFFSRFMSLQMGMAVLLEPFLELSLTLSVLIIRAAPFCIDMLCQYALLGGGRGDSSKHREVLVLTACLRLAAGFLLLLYLRMDEPVLGALGALIIAIGTVLPDTLIWLGLGLFVSWWMSRRKTSARSGKRPRRTVG